MRGTRWFLFFQAEDDIRDAQESRGLGDVYKRQTRSGPVAARAAGLESERRQQLPQRLPQLCLLYTSDAADDLLCVDLGGRRIITKKNSTLIPSSLLTRYPNT